MLGNGAMQRTVVSTSGSTKLDSLAKIAGRISFAKTCREDPDNPTRRAGAGEAATLKNPSTAQQTPITAKLDIMCWIQIRIYLMFNATSIFFQKKNVCLHEWWRIQEELDQGLELLYLKNNIDTMEWCGSHVDVEKRKSEVSKIHKAQIAPNWNILLNKLPPRWRRRRRVANVGRNCNNIVLQNYGRVDQRQPVNSRQGKAGR